MPTQSNTSSYSRLAFHFIVDWFGFIFESGLILESRRPELEVAYD